jgi:hypothetical protein
MSDDRCNLMQYWWWVGSSKILVGGATQLRNFWRDNPSRGEVPPSSCFFFVKGTEPKQKSPRRENGQKILPMDTALLKSCELPLFAVVPRQQGRCWSNWPLCANNKHAVIIGRRRINTPLNNRHSSLILCLMISLLLFETTLSLNS